MYISLPKSVERLAQIFKKNNEKLYVVGGYVRNKILHIDDSENLDIDVCSACLPEKVLKILKGTEFEARYLNEETGVIEIVGEVRVEHATFRRDKYDFSGAHIPNNVEFIKSLEEDAFRRDFRCNAIYYDIQEEEIVDPLDGYEDTCKKLVRTTLKPEDVFYADGERILRMVRVACTLGFSIDEKTYEAAKANVYKLGGISWARRREEFSQIVLADCDYQFLPDKTYAHARGMMMLADLGALKYLLPALEEIRKSGLMDDRNKPLFEHLINVFAFSKPEVRLSALLHDVGKAKAKLQYGNFHGEEEYAPVIIEKNLGVEGLGYSKKIVERVKKVVLGVNFNRRGLETAKSERHFIFENYENIELIIKLKDAIALDKSDRQHGSFTAKKLQKRLETMRNQKTPFNVQDLDVRGDELIRQLPQLKVSKTGDLLEALLDKCVDRPELNKKEDLIAIAKKLVEKRKSPYKEGA